VAVERGLDLVEGERALERRPRPQRMTGRHLVGPDQAAVDQHGFEPHRPFLVIGGGEIEHRRKLFDGETGLVDGPQARIAHGAVERERAALPGRMEHRLVRLRLDLAESIHAAHVVHAVHQLISAREGSCAAIQAASAGVVSSAALSWRSATRTLVRANRLLVIEIADGLSPAATAATTRCLSARCSGSPNRRNMSWKASWRAGSNGRASPSASLAGCAG